MISRGYAGLPPSAQGQRIGLFGGSFDPAHDGHRSASLTALRRVQLDRIWWLITTGNPLKDTSGLPPVADRVEAARKVAAHPQIDVSGFEARVGSPYTSDLVTALAERCPGVRFVLIMGADSFASLHCWRRWRRLADSVPLAVVDRPGFTLQATHTPAAIALSGNRLDETHAARLPTRRPPAYVFLHGKRSPLSSTVLRTSSRQATTTSL